ncbi:MAG: hypothetical protein M1830_000009 [Pleopsidium flavum]|nr:MAG: hypothetical protein M1830_000009 [Pleopsidium flavum]
MQSLLTPPPKKDPITTHVLNTLTGLPAPSLPVHLTLLRPLGPSTPFHALTDANGRITNWTPQAGPSLHEIFANFSEHGDGSAKMVWSLRFDTTAFFGEEGTFWPEVELRFFVKGGEGEGGVHVPVLLGPWSFVAYRGS